ncbi:G patch domain-containing protein 11 [Trichoplax sp. H2]|uniref:G patch domain-containing protein 11 n=1 Tax=Trichoplax adhaerens TaxID=10228 RepID=B3RJI6_TRIAD|nr:hypothetical protein TRIADDRAFT_52639 [Trichoplax adhaerens]EDV29103.1 hypothetical protein TRIADDRAFT_52639 [Trichoplax adhaerens]RDD40294.1 G patch domain-containing protein 11 [Trichoplax sp. H2]|eukprot:XP_002108305.1 hypothetical protein TRIADDRAFT_52639 [Trichoplax adhaerens]
MSEDPEVDDYMSDIYLNEANNSDASRLTEYTRKRRIEEEQAHLKSHQNRMKPLKVLQAEKREEVLKKAIGTDNKGFKLMAKMGYKVGDGLGRKANGIAEPLPINIKGDRGGIGKDEEKNRKRKLQEIRLQQLAKRRQLVEKERAENFRELIRSKRTQQRAKHDLRKAQLACQRLDESKDLNYVKPWYWLIEDDEDEKEQCTLEDDAEDTATEFERLVELNQYLRSKYHYCIWCATTYDDSDDMDNSCPGDCAEDHD